MPARKLRSKASRKRSPGNKSGGSGVANSTTSRLVFWLFVLVCSYSGLTISKSSTIPGGAAHDYSEYFQWTPAIINNNNATASGRINTNNTLPKKMLFVHVGKAGGQTVKHVLDIGCYALRKPKVQKSCLSNLPQTQVSNRTKGYLHARTVFPTRKIVHGADGFLITLRHPVDRSISWFNFHNPDLCRAENIDSMSCRNRRWFKTKPKNPMTMLFKCFPNIKALEDALHSIDNIASTERADHCSSLLVQAWEGNYKGNDANNTRFDHMTYNLQWYGKKVNFHSPIYAVRTDYLWDDMKSIDIMLGGKGDFGQVDGFQYTHHGRNSSLGELDVNARRKICCMLEGDMLWYQKLLSWAENLSDLQARNTWQDAVQYCGEDSWELLQQNCRVMHEGNPNTTYG